MFSSSEGQGYDQNVQDCTINYSIPPISEDQLRLWLQNAPQFSTISVEDDGAYDHLSNSQSKNHGNSSLEDTNLHSYDNSSNTQSSNDIQTRKSHGKEGFEECKRHKRARSTEAHNLKERLRRKKLTQKMAALQEMIPNTVKKDQASTIDDAIKYIKTLQYLVQMMSAEAMFHLPMMMLPQGHKGMELPSLTPFPQIRSGGNGMPFGYPMGLYNPWLFQSSAINSGLHYSVQYNKEKLLESMHANGISSFGFPPSSVANGEAKPSQGATR